MIKLFQRIFYKLCGTKFNITRLKSTFASQQHVWGPRWPTIFGLAYIFLQSRAHSSQICCWITKQRGDMHIHWLHPLTPILHKSLKKIGEIYYTNCAFHNEVTYFTLFLFTIFYFFGLRYTAINILLLLLHVNQVWTNKSVDFINCIILRQSPCQQHVTTANETHRIKRYSEQSWERRESNYCFWNIIYKFIHFKS